ncbi:MAG TPA: glycosyl hydrolase family 28-related protein [Candidatus Angelobacter sp.]|nr:glycosyl hydrolase family 28-related protein [Candidatus Angelobacter sp.]
MAIGNIFGGAFQDAGGNVLSGGSITFQLSNAALVIGTGQIVQNVPQTFTLNNLGSVPANTPLWFNDQLQPNGTHYIVTIYNSNGALVRGPEDWVIAGSSPVDLGTIVISSPTVSYFPVFPKAIIGNLDNLRIVDGITFTTIQAAINDLPSNGGAVYVPAGTYVISSSITIPSNVTLYGAGPATIIQLANGVNSQYAITNTHAATTGDTNIVIRDLIIDGNKANQAPTGGQRTGCIQFTKVTGGAVLRTECRNGYNNIVQILDGCSLIFIEDNYVHDNTQGNGIVVGTLPMTIGISDVFIRGNRVGPVTSADAIFTLGYIGSSYACNRIVIADNSVYDTGDVSIEIGVGSTNVSCTGNRITLNGHGPTGIMVRGALNVTCTGNQVVGTGVTSNEDGFFIWGDPTIDSGGGGDPDCANVTVTGNTLTSLSRSGIFVQAQASGTVTQLTLGPNTIVGAGTNIILSANATNVAHLHNSDGLVNTVGTDLTFSPDSSHYAHFTRPTSVSHSSLSFTPDSGAEIHIRTTGAANALTVESTNDASVGINIKDTAQSWGFALRSDKSEAVVLRNLTSSTDTFTFSTGGALTATSTMQGTVINGTTGFQVNGTAASGNVLRGNGTNFVSAQLAAADLSNGVTGSGAVVLASAPTIANPIVTGTITAPAFVSSTANPASTGQIRLAAGDQILFRNAANNADLNGIQKKADDSMAIGSSAFGVSMTGKMVMYNNIATTGNGIGSTYFQTDLTSQNASIGSTTIITGTSSTGGHYVVSFNLFCTTSDASGASVSLTVAYTSDGVSRTFVSSGVAFASTNNGSIVALPINVDNSTNITFSTTVTGTPSTGKYSVHMWAVKQ